MYTAFGESLTKTVDFFRRPEYTGNKNIMNSLATKEGETMSMAVNSTLPNYTYTYQNKLQPKLDKDDDARWSKSEVQSYADSYKRATGQKLDVDKIMEKYAGEDGYIQASDWAKVRDDDALGFSKLTAAKNSTASTSGTTTNSNVDMSALSGFTYTSQSKLQPNLDKNHDGYWDKDEVTKFAEAYKKATGSGLDVDKIMEKYAGEDGKIGYAGQTQIRRDDAFGLSKLTTTTVEVKNPSKSTAKEVNLTDLMNSMSSAKKASFSNMIQKYETMSSLLQNFTSVNSVGSMFNMYSAMSQRNLASIYQSSMRYGGTSANYQSMANQMLNMVI